MFTHFQVLFSTKKIDVTGTDIKTNLSHKNYVFCLLGMYVFTSTNLKNILCT